MTAAVGVDIGGTFVKAARVGPGGRIEDRVRMPTPPSPSELVEAVSGAAERLGPALPLGVGAAGLVDHHRGVLTWAPHLPGEDVHLAAPLVERRERTVFVDNDANCAAVGEHRHGAAADFRHVMMITLGTGIGMGLLVDGRIHRGQGYAGEVGHMTVDADGEACACGRRGCWETKVSGSRLQAGAADVLGSGASAADLVEAARNGHREAVEVVSGAGEWLARGVESLVLALDPEVVVVGGAAASDLLLEPVRKRLEHTEGAGHRPVTPVRAGRLGAEAGAVGAAVCAAEESRR